MHWKLNPNNSNEFWYYDDIGMIVGTVTAKPSGVVAAANGVFQGCFVDIVSAQRRVEKCIAEKNPLLSMRDSSG